MEVWDVWFFVFLILWLFLVFFLLGNVIENFFSFSVFCFECNCLFFVDEEILICVLLFGFVLDMELDISMGFLSSLFRIISKLNV